MEYLILAIGLVLIMVGVLITVLQFKIIKEQKEQKQKINRLKI
jgi:hypothetical protein